MTSGRSGAPARALSVTAFVTLLLIALIMGANHVAARIAFNHGTDVATAVVFRSGVTALVVALLVLLQGVPVQFTPRQRRVLPVIGLLIGLQSLCLYSAVARLPVALALLAFNTFPIFTAGWAWVLYRARPAPTLVRAMPVILVGLTLALAAAASFGLALVLTQHEAADVDGRVRSATTMAMAGLVALVAVGVQGGFHLPQAAPGWWGLVALTCLYGTGFTLMFTLLPRLGVVGNSAILNVEPVFALGLAWLVLGQSIALIQVAGALLVVGAVVMLGLRKRA